MLAERFVERLRRHEAVTDAVQFLEGRIGETHQFSLA
jgi:hypothetical protein